MLDPAITPKVFDYELEQPPNSFDFTKTQSPQPVIEYTPPAVAPNFFNQDELPAIAAPGKQTVATVGVLVATAYASYYGERHGWFVDLPDALRASSESMAHPIIGYIGWRATSHLLRFTPNSVKHTASLTVATYANFFVEELQQNLSPPNPHYNYLASHNKFETTKDYLFALAGAGLAFWQSKRNAANQT